MWVIFLTAKELTARIKDRIRELGYADCGVAHVEPFDEYAEKLRDRIARFPHAREHYAGLMDRVDPRRRFSRARTLLVCIWRYGQYARPYEADSYIGKNYLFDGRMEWSEHRRAKKKLQDFFSTLNLNYTQAEVPDRWAAVRAGVGRFGRNNFIYTDYGSWINIETWLLEAELEQDEPATGIPCPEGCRKCIQACPSKALHAPFSMDWSLCIAYLTYRAPTPIPDRIKSRMGTWIYGCDVCQDVCPLNSGRWSAEKEFPRLSEVAAGLNPRSLFEMDEDFFRREIYPRFFYTEDLVRWKANALRAIANSGDKSCLPLVEKALRSGNERLEFTARWARKRLAAEDR